MIILTNDDGIDAPGLAALQRATRGLPTLVVAPAIQMSECSHCVTTKRAIPVEKRTSHGTLPHYAVAGTPADCVRIALLRILPSMNVNIKTVRVISGINAGGNLGADVYISGTVAAAREAAFFGLPAIAISQYRKAEPSQTHWDRAATWTQQVIEALSTEVLAAGEFWNVNLPWVGNADTLPEIVFCERSRRPLPVKYEELEGHLRYVTGLYHTRDYEAASDIDVCFGGKIAATRMAI
jgi:5'-nucleotidase